MGLVLLSHVYAGRGLQKLHIVGPGLLIFIKLLLWFLSDSPAIIADYEFLCTSLG